MAESISLPGPLNTAVPPASAQNGRHPFLAGPIAAALLRQALPILIVLAVQSFVGVAETWFVGRLGTQPLAGMTLVFPVLMLMTMVSNGGIGSGIASAVSRAIGEGRRGDADRLVVQALVVAVICGALCSMAAWLLGPSLYRLMGGRGEALEHALRYSNLAFAAAIPIWTVNALSAALRGAGNVKVPAMTVLAGALLTLVISPALIFGLGPLPALGVAGAGVAMIAYYVLASLVLLRYLRSPNSPLKLQAGAVQGPLVRRILAVGVPASFSALQANLIAVIFTGMVGQFGAQALAGYGIASRLDFMIIPLLFALGTASVAMVGMNLGAGQLKRARQVAWTAAALSAGLVAVIGAVAALWPEGWVGRFSTQPEVLDAGTAYLQHVAPFYAMSGIGMALLFAGQGAGVVVMPLFIGTFTLLFALAGSWWVVRVAGGDMAALFWVVGGSRALFGALMLTTLWFAKGWRPRPRTA
jgi:putative MATE family efflux protein